MTDIKVHYSGKSVHIMHDDPTVLCEGGCEGDPTPSPPLSSPPDWRVLLLSWPVRALSSLAWVSLSVSLDLVAAEERRAG